MAWSWNWAVFLALIVICTVVVQFARGAMNASNVAKYGEDADYKNNFGPAFFGSIISGAIYALIITAIMGFLL